MPSHSSINLACSRPTMPSASCSLYRRSRTPSPPGRTPPRAPRRASCGTAHKLACGAARKLKSARTTPRPGRRACPRAPAPWLSRCSRLPARRAPELLGVPQTPLTPWPCRSGSSPAAKGCDLCMQRGGSSVPRAVQTCRAYRRAAPILGAAPVTGAIWRFPLPRGSYSTHSQQHVAGLPFLTRAMPLPLQPRGGMRDKPGKPADLYHTCYCLSGLAQAQAAAGLVVGGPSNGLAPVDPLCNVRADRLAFALAHFQAQKRGEESGERGAGSSLRPPA